jgi:hypothetical protein
MPRPTVFGWLMIAAGLATVGLAFVVPTAAIVTGVIFALLLLALLSEGTSAGITSGGLFDVDASRIQNERKREALARRVKRGRPEWERTPPDHADQDPDVAWERERKRRGLT